MNFMKMANVWYQNQSKNQHYLTLAVPRDAGCDKILFRHKNEYAHKNMEYAASDTNLYKMQNFNGSNTFGTTKICSRQG